MRPRLIRPEDTVPGQTFEQAARAELEKILAKQPGFLMIVYEIDRTAYWESIPDLASAERGLIQQAWEAMNDSEV